MVNFCICKYIVNALLLSILCNLVFKCHGINIISQIQNNNKQDSKLLKIDMHVNINYSHDNHRKLDTIIN